jgi:hypothetical protein
MPPSNEDNGRNSPINNSDHGHSDHDDSDSSGNVTITYDVSGSSTYVSHVQDISTNNIFSATCDDNTDLPLPTPIVSDLSSTTIRSPGYDITNQSGRSADGSYIIREIFSSSTDPSNNDVNINANLTEIVTTYVDASNNNQADILSY